MESLAHFFNLPDLKLFALVIFKAGVRTGVLPGLFAAALVEAKYHRLTDFLQTFFRSSGDGQLAPLLEFNSSDLSSRATSPSRKVRSA